jgi:hypothetical protein
MPAVGKPTTSRTTLLLGLWRCLWPMLTGVLFVVAFYGVGERFCNHFLLDLGSIDRPTPGYARFLRLWSLFGTGAAAFLTWGFVRLASPDRGRRRDPAGASFPTDSQWVVLGTLAGLLIPLALRTFLLQAAPLTDDESAYRFMAQLLASGRLRATSPPLKLFFDREFMINDGHLYAQYFVGFPALLVPGVWLGHPGVMNAVYCALTVPALFAVARRLAGSLWAKVGVAIYLCSPMLMVAAATELAHTTCVLALAWMTWFCLRSRDDGAPWWTHAGIALSFGVAFFNRPITAGGIGLPVLIWWAAGLRALRGRRLAVAGSGFLVCALVMAGLFLAVNKVQNGSVTTIAYQRMHAYMKENNYRFAGWQNEEQLNRRSLAAIPVQAGIVLWRLNFDLFGWPSSFVFAVFAGMRRRAWLWWLSLTTFLLLHLLALPFDAGIDSFGPVHYTEAAWPILLLTVLGLRRMSGVRGARQPLALALVSALVVVAWFGFVPVRFGTLARIADNINMPREAVRQARLHNAVVFAPRPFAPNCRSAPAQHFVFWRPNNDPDLRDDVLWANHISIEQDHRLMEYFPGRSGYVMVWIRPCRVAILPLDSLDAGSVPDGFIGGTGEGPS